MVITAAAMSAVSPHADVRQISGRYRVSMSTRIIWYPQIKDNTATHQADALLQTPSISIGSMTIESMR